MRADGDLNDTPYIQLEIEEDPGRRPGRVEMHETTPLPNVAAVIMATVPSPRLNKRGCLRMAYRCIPDEKVRRAPTLFSAMVQHQLLHLFTLHF